MDYKSIFIGDKKASFVRVGNKVVFPKYAGHEDLILWYDFMGKTNSDSKRGTAEDLSGNGNDGTLQNFEYTSESGYDDGLAFDPVDDYILISPRRYSPNNYSVFVLFKTHIIADQYLIGNSGAGGLFLLRNNGSLGFAVTQNNGVVYYIDTDPAVVNFYENTQAGIVCNVETSSVKIYVNNQLVHEETIPNGITDQSFAYVGYRPVGSKFGGVMYSLRKHNNVLTPAEIQTNYQIDKQRFNLP